MEWSCLSLLNGGGLGAICGDKVGIDSLTQNYSSLEERWLLE